MSSNIFFTSDHHFGHENIIEHCDRPFESLNEMNEMMIEKWNNKVGKNDLVYHLGDLSLLKADKTLEIIKRLNGRKRYIFGNHDKSWVKNKDCQKCFEVMKDLDYIKIGEQKIMLCHYAMLIWRSSYRGSYHFYGHSHCNICHPNKKAFHVGVDTCDFEPLEFSEIDNIIKAR